MLSYNKIRAAYIVFAIMFEMMLAVASSVYLKFGSLSFVLVVLTALIAIGPIVYFILNHRP
jgi:hypothetical protein